MKRTVTINVPAHVVISLFVGLGLWLIGGDGVWAYAYTCGAIFPILIDSVWPSPKRHEGEP